jgi:transcriptional regulator with XRE-family HTH domain
MMDHIGATIKKRRKRLGISRKWLAGQLGVSTQTILNVEQDSAYNIGTKLLKTLEPILNVKFGIIMNTEEAMDKMIKLGNDEFILYIRKNFPKCTIKNDRLGSRIWQWLRDNAGGKKLYGDEAQPAIWGDSGAFVDEVKLPRKATQFEFSRSNLPELYSFLDRLGQEQE